MNIDPWHKRKTKQKNQEKDINGSLCNFAFSLTLTLRKRHAFSGLAHFKKIVGLNPFGKELSTTRCTPAQHYLTLILESTIFHLVVAQPRSLGFSV